MKFDKWLKRKYPKNYNLILGLYKDVNELEYMFKVGKYRPAIWAYKGDSFPMVKYGDLILAVCSKEYFWEEWNGLYDEVHGSSDKWLGTYDCRFYTFEKINEQHQVYSKYWEYLKE